MDKDYGMKSIIRLGVNNQQQMFIDVDYDMFGSDAEDVELLYLLIGAIEKTKGDLLEIIYQIQEGQSDEEAEDSDENFDW